MGGEQQRRVLNPTESRTTDKGGGLEMRDRAPTVGALGLQEVGRTWEPSQRGPAGRALGRGARAQHGR
eukprot:1782504-Rhodomonas_salina.1